MRQVNSPSPHSQISLQQRKIRRKFSWQRTLRYFYHRLMRMEGSVESIARGLAVGVFAGWFPWFGLQIVFALVLAVVVRGNKLIAAAATWISNPLTYIPIFGLNYYIGRQLLGMNDEPFEMNALTSWDGVKELGVEILVPLFVGSFVIGSVCSIIAYFVGHRVVYRSRQRRLHRRRLNFAKRLERL